MDANINNDRNGDFVDANINNDRAEDLLDESRNANINNDIAEDLVDVNITNDSDDDLVDANFNNDTNKDLVDININNHRVGDFVDENINNNTNSSMMNVHIDNDSESDKAEAHKRKPKHKIKPGKREIDDESTDDDQDQSESVSSNNTNQDEAVSVSINDVNPEQSVSGTPNFSEPDASVDILSVHSDDTDALCQFWPMKIIEDSWNDRKYDIDMSSNERIERCLYYWAGKCGLQEWVYDDKFMEKPIPKIHLQIAAQEMCQDMTNLNTKDENVIHELYTNVIMQDDKFMYMMQGELHQQWMSHISQTNSNVQSQNPTNANVNSNSNNENLKQWDDFINEMNQEIWKVNETMHDYNRKGPAKIEPLTEPNNQWFPGENELWMEQFYRMVIRADSVDQTSNLIARLTHKQMLQMIPDNSAWIPKNPWHLYRMYQPYACKNPVRVIRCKVLEKNAKNVSEYRERIYTYDSFVNDWKMYLQNDLHRNALLGSQNQFLKIHKHNPIHIPSREFNELPKGKIHSSQWRISKFGFFKFIERIVFINGTNVHSNKYWDTQMVTIGTFIEIPNLDNDTPNNFGLVTDVINYKWTFDLSRHPDETLLEWHVRLILYIQKFCDEPDTIENEFLYPMYTLEYLPLLWKYHYCCYPNEHEHATFENPNSRHLWLDCTGLQDKASNLVRTVPVSDHLQIWSLSIDGLLLFPNPNFASVDKNIPEHTIWKWNVIIDGTEAMSPLGNLILIELFECLKDPFEPIWAGRIDSLKPANTHFVVPLQFNSDAFEFVKTTNAWHGKKSIKENFVAALNHALSCNLMVSIGVVLSGTNNIPFYTMFAKEILRSIFVGHEIYIKTLNKKCKFYLYLAGLVNDGDEVRSSTGIVGAAGNRPDYFTVLNKSSPMRDCLYQPWRHYKITLTQSV